MLHYSDEARINAQTASAAKRYAGVPGRKLFVTGGIGDFLAIESHLDCQVLAETSVVYHLGYRPNLSRQLISRLTPNLKDYQFFWHCLNSKEKTWAYQRKILATMLEIDPSIQDMVVHHFFSSIKNGMKGFKGSSFVVTHLADIAHLGLPDTYWLIQPHSINSSEQWHFRTFSEEEWQETLRWLRRTNSKGVVIGLQCPRVPVDDSIINLSDKTSIFEGIEIAKKAFGYIGVDSCFSVIAAQVIPAERIYIKSKSRWCYDNLSVYFAPHRSFEFVHEEVSLKNFNV